MRRFVLPAALTAVMVGACAHEPELLNSERIEARFGSYGVEVLAQGPRRRHSSLYSREGGVKTCRTYAIVEFLDPEAEGIAVPHAAVRSGQSLGSTFRNAGWTIRKRSLYTGQADVDPGNRIAQLMRVTSARAVAVHVYRLSVERDEERIEYADVVEIHHPDYLSLEELDELFPVADADRLDAEALRPFVAPLQSDYYLLEHIRQWGPER
jgi:hypothetical protein